MSIKTIDPQRSFYHTSYLCGELFGPTDRYRLFREKIWPKLLELGARLHSFYCEDNGRPAIDPVRLAGVTLLQFMEKAPDRVAAERTLYHLGWKYALDLELGAGGFHPTVLVYFRDRLEEKKAERVIFDAAVDLLVELGLIKRKGKQRLDSTHIVGYVKEMSRLECATETMRLALRDLESELRGEPRPEFWQGLWALYVQSQLDWRMSKAEREGRYLQCGQDMRRLLEWLERHRLDFSELESVRLLRLGFWNKSLRLRPSGHRGRCAIRTIPMPIMQRSGKSSGWATRYTWWRVWNQRSPPRKKANRRRILLPRFSRWRRPKTRWRDGPARSKTNSNTMS